MKTEQEIEVRFETLEEELRAMGWVESHDIAMNRRVGQLVALLWVLSKSGENQ